MRKATRFLTRFVYLDDTARDSLRRQLHRAGMDITPEQFTARKYVIYAGAGVAALLCAIVEPLKK